MDCKEWLKEFLSSKDFVLCDIVKAEANQHGFSKKQLREARVLLGIKTFKRSENWFWYLEE